MAVAWAKDELKPIVAENLDFAAKKKAIAQLSPKGARMLSGLLYAKYRQLLEAKCFRAGVELILIDPAYYVDHRCGEIRNATGLECACKRSGRDRPSRTEVD